MFGFLSQGVIGDILAPVKSPGQQLHQAIEDNLADKAIRLIREEQVDFNFRDYQRDNAVPLHTAAKAGSQALVDFLLDMGASLHVKDGTGNTPLHYAAKAGRVELVKYLVSKGADVAGRNNHRHTPYDVATNHIIRQYLLPLQLRAEPQPEPDGLSAVHNPDIVRDYSNLPPPPTSFPAQAFAAPPTHYAVPRQTAWTDPAVTRPIAADGFHSSAGDPKLAEKYGHTKTEINIAPPPAIRPDGQPKGPPQPVPQFSAFAHGRPMARYVAYNAVDNQPVPWQAPSAYSASPPPPQQQQLQQPPHPGPVPPAPLPHPHHASPPGPASFAAPPPPPPPPMQQPQPVQATSPVQVYGVPQPPAPHPQQVSSFQPIAVQPHSAPPTAVPRLPSPNRDLDQPTMGSAQGPTREAYIAARACRHDFESNSSCLAVPECIRGGHNRSTRRRMVRAVALCVVQEPRRQRDSAGAGHDRGAASGLRRRKASFLLSYLLLILLYTPLVIGLPHGKNPPPSGWPTWREQREVEAKVRSRLAATMGVEEPTMPLVLLADQHAVLLKRVLKEFVAKGVPKAFSSSVPWCFFWVLHSLDLLGEAVEDEGLKDQLVERLHSCLAEDGGGFGGGPGQDPHVCSSFSAVCALAILGRLPPWLHLGRMEDFLQSLRRGDGSFRTCPFPDSEADARATYCAVGLARLCGCPLAQQPGGLFERTGRYLASLQTYEGGFAGEALGGPGDDEAASPLLLGEAHCGFAYCCVAALELLRPSMGPEEAAGAAWDREGLVRWVRARQKRVEGGFCGRANKLVDVCYSFWAGALPPLCGRADHVDWRALVRYILAVSQQGLVVPEEEKEEEDQQQQAGGFSDKPGLPPDYYHTCYALSGLSVALHHGQGGTGGEGGPLFEVQGSGVRRGGGVPRRTDLLVNVCTDRLEAWDLLLHARAAQRSSRPEGHVE